MGFYGASGACWTEWQICGAVWHKVRHAGAESYWPHRSIITSDQPASFYLDEDKKSLGYLFLRDAGIQLKISERDPLSRFSFKILEYERPVASEDDQVIRHHSSLFELCERFLVFYDSHLCIYKGNRHSRFPDGDIAGFYIWQEF